MKIYAAETKKDIFKINIFPDRITTGKGFKGTEVNQACNSSNGVALLRGQKREIILLSFIKPPVPFINY